MTWKISWLICCTVDVCCLVDANTADVNTCYRHHSSSGATLSDGMRIRLLSAQRDMYISGFCLFLFL